MTAQVSLFRRLSLVTMLFFLSLSSFFVSIPILAEEGSESPLSQTDNALASWHISGSNTIRSEYYGVRGDPSASPYSEEGMQTYDEFSLNLDRRMTPFDTWRGQVFGVLNDSDYRGSENGFVPERLNLFHEKGDAFLPHRVEAGDIYGFFSPRTLQRSLKGLQLEFQPIPGPSKRYHSILFLTGANQASWRHFQPRDNYTNGFSYLLNDPVFGSLSLNFVHNDRKRDRGAGMPRRLQQVWSVAGEKIVSLGSQRLTVEGEAGHFSGDHDNARNRDENGIYFQVSGKGRLPFTYRFRFEQYGEHYQPEGAAVSSDRRSGEAHAGWRFASGLQLRTRIQYFRDGYESTNPTDTNTCGISLSGPFLAGHVHNLSGSLDAFVQDVENRDKTTDHVVKSMNMNLSRPLQGGWNGRLGLYWQNVDSQVAGTGDTTTKQVSISADHGLGVAGFKGSITPGVVVRKSEGASTEALDIVPTLALDMSRGPHSLRYNLGFNYQDRWFSSGTDISCLSNNLSYRYAKGRNTFGVELVSEHRNPDPGGPTTSYKAGIFWTYSFDKPAGKGKMAAMVMGPPSGPPPIVEVDLSELMPGSGIREVRERLAGAGIRGAAEQPGILIYETRLLEEIEQRQRLVLVHEAGRLKKSALIIEFDDVGRPEDMMETFERVRKLLIDRYGRPDNFFDRGEAGARLAEDINDSAFIRITEWHRPGGIIRFGIPRRRDREVRMEVQFAKEFPPVTETLWSIEAVRQ